jgi:Yeast cortical protein KAR9
VTGIIDQSLMSLDEKLESVEKGIKAVTENVESLSPKSAAVPTPTTAKTITAFTTPTVDKSFGHTSEVAAILRKHTTLLADWEAVQEDSDVLREELKEDKWLTVFRTVTDQADGMMSSLEKAVNRCQVCFHWAVF